MKTLAKKGGAEMVTISIKKRSYIVVVCIGLFAIFSMFTPSGFVRAEQKESPSHWRLEKKHEVSTDQSNHLKKSDSHIYHIDHRQKVHSSALLCHGKGPKNKQNQSETEETSSEEKSKKREGCDVDPNAEKTETASVEHKNSDSTLLYLSGFAIFSVLLVGYLLYKKTKKR